MKVVIIDNYDSFTYNLSHLIKELGAEVTVLRNDQFELSDLEPYNKIVLSPGPGIPSEAGLLLDVIRTYAGKKPMVWQPLVTSSPMIPSSAALNATSLSAAITHGWSQKKDCPTA